MTRLTAGDTLFRAKSSRSGTTSEGRPWEQITVVDEFDKNEISIFPSNVPCGVNRGDTFRITSIFGVSTGHRNVQGKWFHTVTVNAEIVPA